VRLNNLACVIFFVFDRSLYKFCLIGVKGKIGKEKGKVCSYGAVGNFVETCALPT
jgi:hypothetical protein